MVGENDSQVRKDDSPQYEGPSKWSRDEHREEETHSPHQHGRDVDTHSTLLLRRQRLSRGSDDMDAVAPSSLLFDFGLAFLVVSPELAEDKDPRWVSPGAVYLAWQD